MADAHRYVGRDGIAVRALQYDGRVAGFYLLLTSFPARILPHPHRDDAVLVTTASDRRVRIGAGDWVVETAPGQLETYPDDAFRILHAPAPA